MINPAVRCDHVRAGEIELTLTEALHGAIPVSRAAPELVAPVRRRRSHACVATGSEVTSESWCGASSTRVWPSGWRSWRDSWLISCLARRGHPGKRQRVPRPGDCDGVGRCGEANRGRRARRLQIERADMVGGGEIVVSRFYQRAARARSRLTVSGCVIGRLCRDPELRAGRVTAAVDAAKLPRASRGSDRGTVGHCSHWRKAVIRTALTTTSTAKHERGDGSAGRKQRHYAKPNKVSSNGTRTSRRSLRFDRGAAKIPKARLQPQAR